MLAAPGPKGLGESLLSVSQTLAQLANTAGEQASTLTGSMANTAMEQAVEFGKQVADMTNQAMSTLKGGPGGMGMGAGQSASPPVTQTEKAGALNLLDEIGFSGSGGGSIPISGDASALQGFSSQDIDQAQSRAIGVPLGAEGELPQSINDFSTDVPYLFAAAQGA